MPPITVLVVDDEALVRRALTVFVDLADDLEVVGEAADGAAALRRCEALHPDIVLMDIQMPVMDGVAATHEIGVRFPATRVVALTTFSSERFMIPALRAGASGYLLKDTEPEDLVSAIRDVHQGGFVLSPRATRDLVAAVRETPVPPEKVELPTADELSDREREVVELLGRGMSNAEIAAELHVSEATVKTHMSRVMSKWGVRDRVQVLIRATQLSLVRL